MKAIKTTIIGGIVFLIPLVVLAVLFGKAFQLSMLVAKPLGAVLPLDPFMRVVLAEILAVVVIVLVCFAAGLLARHARIRARVNRLDAALVEIAPGYSFAKTMVSGLARAEEGLGSLKPVIVRFDDCSQIALEVERIDGGPVVLFLPGSPSPWSGGTVAVDAGRVTPLEIPAHEAIKRVRVLGRGSAALMPH